MHGYEDVEEMIKDRLWSPGKGLSAFDSASNYMGEDNSEWVVAIGKTRDSDILDRANFDAMLEALGGEQEDKVKIFGVNHWACGWVDQILVHKTAQKELETLLECLNALANYPVLDDSKYSEMEWEEQEQTYSQNVEYWKNEVRNKLNETLETEQEKKDLEEVIQKFYQEDCSYCGVQDGWFVIDKINNYRSCDSELKDNSVYQMLKEKFYKS